MTSALRSTLTGFHVRCVRGVHLEGLLLGARHAAGHAGHPGSGHAPGRAAGGHACGGGHLQHRHGAGESVSIVQGELGLGRNETSFSGDQGKARRDMIRRTRFEGRSASSSAESQRNRACDVNQATQGSPMAGLRNIDLIS